MPPAFPPEPPPPAFAASTCPVPAPFDLQVVRGEGVWLLDAAGRRYLDLQTSQAAALLGHRHPAVCAAAKAQLDLVHRTSYLLPVPAMAKLRSSLAALCGTEAAQLTSSRQQAMHHVGLAVAHAARAARRRGPVLVCGAEDDASLAYGLTLPTRRVPWGEADAVATALRQGALAVVLEPAQVRQRIALAPPGYLTAVAAACAAHDVPLVVDESRCGLGRLGALRAAEADGARADLSVLGHNLGAGLVPVTAVVGRRALLDPVAPQASDSPLEGHAFTCAVAQTVVDVLGDGELLRHGRAMGQRLRQGLLAADLPGIAAVDGAGTWLSVALQPSLGPARAFCAALARQGVLAIDAGANVLQLAPALVIDPRQVDWAVERLVETLGVPA